MQRKFGFKTTTDTEELFKDKNLSAVVISTQRQSLQIYFAISNCSKACLCRKPLCIKPSEITLIEEERGCQTVYHSSIVMVGFNRDLHL